MISLSTQKESMQKDKKSYFGKISREWHLGCSLLDAMKFGRLEDVLLLAKSNINPNVLLPEYGITPMHCAAGIEPEELGIKCTIEFLNKGGNPNVKCSEGVTPVHVASIWKRIKVLTILMSHGGDPEIADDNGHNAFFYAAANEEVVKVLSEVRNGNNEDLPKLTKFDFERKKPGFSKTDQKSKTCADSEVSDHDLELNAKALSLIIKHRRGIFIYESQPEEDTTSSSTIDTELNEDFYYDPDEEMTPPVEINSDSDKSELCKEDILNADKTRVIQVITENVNKSLRSDNSKRNRRSKKESEILSHGIKKREKKHLSNKKDKQNLKSNYCSTQKTAISTKTNEKYSNEVYSENNNTCSENNSDYDGHIVIYEHNTGDSNYRSDHIHNDIIQSSLYSEQECTNAFNNDKEYSKSKERLSSSSSSLSSDLFSHCSSQKSDSNKLSRKVSTDSSSRIPDSLKLPKSIRDKLLLFKINTHYKSKTRTVRIQSKSCEGFKTKRSLYVTGYEYWSSRVRTRSYPCYTKPRLNHQLNGFD